MNTRAQQDKNCKETWKIIEDAVLSAYGFLVPTDDLTVTVTLPWTKEGMLGTLKRNGRIKAWSLDKEYEEGNMRRYTVVVDGERI